MNVAGLWEFDVVARRPLAFEVVVGNDSVLEGARGVGRDDDHGDEDVAKVYCVAGGLRA